MKILNSNTVVKHGKELRCGYTTGSCAAAAATAAAEMLFSQKETAFAKIILPSGGEALFEILNTRIMPAEVQCSVIKSAGDDPDVTDGICITAKVSLCQEGIQIMGGKGVGVVTAKGLKCKQGEAAINPIPRKMIAENLKAMCARHAYGGGLCVELSVPNGEEIAKRTFNARLGIVGGISILGTTGIVEPMSEQALVDTIKLMIDKAKAKHAKTILISPGNYGKDYCLNQLGLDVECGIKFSNFLGETLDYLVYKGFQRVLLVGHIGKLVKVAGGVMNTHSRVADCRMEILAAHSAMAGANAAAVSAVMACRNTEEAIEIIKQQGLEKQVFASMLEKMQFYINDRTKQQLQTELIVFSNQNEVLMQTEAAAALAAEIRAQHHKA